MNIVTRMPIMEILSALIEDRPAWVAIYSLKERRKATPFWGVGLGWELVPYAAMAAAASLPFVYSLKLSQLLISSLKPARW